MTLQLEQSQSTHQKIDGQLVAHFIQCLCVWLKSATFQTAITTKLKQNSKNLKFADSALSLEFGHSAGSHRGNCRYSQVMPSKYQKQDSESNDSFLGHIIKG